MQVLTEENNLVNIANSIRNKTGIGRKYAPAEMAGAIAAIETGGNSGGMKDCGIVRYEKNKFIESTEFNCLEGDFNAFKFYGLGHQNYSAISNLIDWEYNINIFKHYDEGYTIFPARDEYNIIYGIYFVKDDSTQKINTNFDIKIKTEDSNKGNCYYNFVDEQEVSTVIYYTDGTSTGIGGGYGTYCKIEKPVDYIKMRFTLGTNYYEIRDNQIIQPNYFYGYGSGYSYSDDTRYGKGLPTPSVYLPNSFNFYTGKITITDEFSKNLAYFNSPTYWSFDITDIENGNKITFLPGGVPSPIPSGLDRYCHITSSFNIAKDSYYLLVTTLDLNYFNIIEENLIEVTKSDKYNAILLKGKSNQVSVTFDFFNSINDVATKTMEVAIIGYNGALDIDSINKKVENLLQIGLSNITPISMDIEVPSNLYGFAEENSSEEIEYYYESSYVDIVENKIHNYYSEKEINSNNFGISYTTQGDYVVVYIYRTNYDSKTDYPYTSDNDMNNVFSTIAYPMSYNEYTNIGYNDRIDRCYIAQSGTYMYIMCPDWRYRNDDGSYNSSSKVAQEAIQTLLNSHGLVYYKIKEYSSDYSTNPFTLKAYSPITSIKQSNEIKRQIEVSYKIPFEIKDASTSEKGIVSIDGKTLNFNNDEQLFVRDIETEGSFNYDYENMRKCSGVSSLKSFNLKGKFEVGSHMKNQYEKTYFRYVKEDTKFRLGGYSTNLCCDLFDGNEITENTKIMKQTKKIINLNLDDLQFNSGRIGYYNLTDSDINNITNIIDSDIIAPISLSDSLSLRLYNSLYLDKEDNKIYIGAPGLGYQPMANCYSNNILIQRGENQIEITSDRNDLITFCMEMAGDGTSFNGGTKWYSIVYVVYSQTNFGNITITENYNGNTTDTVLTAKVSDGTDYYDKKYYYAFYEVKNKSVVKTPADIKTPFIIRNITNSAIYSQDIIEYYVTDKLYYMRDPNLDEVIWNLEVTDEQKESFKNSLSSFFPVSCLCATKEFDVRINTTFTFPNKDFEIKIETPDTSSLVPTFYGTYYKNSNINNYLMKLDKGALTYNGSYDYNYADYITYSTGIYEVYNHRRNVFPEKNGILTIYQGTYFGYAIFESSTGKTWKTMWDLQSKKNLYEWKEL